jgi:hypothetical protein
MADDRMKEDNLERNMGGTSGEGRDSDFDKSQQTPGRNPSSGQKGGQQSGQGGQQREPLGMDDEEDLDAGGASKRGGQNL